MGVCPSLWFGPGPNTLLAPLWPKHERAAQISSWQLGPHCTLREALSLTLDRAWAQESLKNFQPSV